MNQYSKKVRACLRVIERGQCCGIYHQSVKTVISVKEMKALVFVQTNQKLVLKWLQVVRDSLNFEMLCSFALRLIYSSFSLLTNVCNDH